MKAVTILSLAGAALAQQSVVQALNSTNATTGLVTLLGSYPQVATALAGLDNVTLLAPSNDAIAKFAAANAAAIAADPGLIPATLYYHVVNASLNSTQIVAATGNGPVFVRTALSNDSYESVDGAQYLEVTSKNGTVTLFSAEGLNSTVVQADIKFGQNSYIHVISDLLTIPQNVSTTAIAANLTSLASALNSTNLLSTVDGLNNVTIFAPTNAAFAAIANVTSGLNQTQLQDVLKFHVVPNAVAFSPGLSNGQVITTLSGKNLTVQINNGSVYINNAKVVAPNVLVRSGVVHVIDAVLIQNATAPGTNSTSSGSGSSTATTTGKPTATGSGSGSSSSGAASTGAASFNQAIPLAGLIAAGAALFL